MIFIGGVSAGAITADHYAYLDSTDNLNFTLDSVIQSNGGFDGNTSSNYQYSTEIKGVLNYSGALRHDYWIQADNVPLFSVHEDQDPVVPYEKQITTSLGTPIEVSGSGALHLVAEEVDIMNRLITIENSNGHVKYFLDGPNTEVYGLVIDSTMAFLERIMCTEPQGINDQNLHQIRVYPNPSTSSIFVEGLHSSSCIKLIDILGKTRKVSKSHVLHVDDLSAGIYFLQIEVNDGLVSKKVIVK